MVKRVKGERNSNQVIYDFVQKIEFGDGASEFSDSMSRLRTDKR